MNKMCFRKQTLCQPSEIEPFFCLLLQLARSEHHQAHELCQLHLGEKETQS